MSAVAVRFESVPRRRSRLDRVCAAYFGYCMSGDISEQIMPVGIGKGANGKSVIMDTLAYVLGDYCGPAPESLLLASTRKRTTFATGRIAKASG